MRIVFKKIPKLAIAFYCVGFLILASALYAFFYRPDMLEPYITEPVVLQQMFIAGAIIVALGSVVNSLYQFKPRDNPQTN